MTLTTHKHLPPSWLKPISAALALGLLALGLTACAVKPGKLATRQPLAETAANAAGCSGENPKPDIQCAASPAVAFDLNGRLWAVWAQGGRIYASQSKDFGNTFAAPVAANPGNQPVADNDTARPKVALSKLGAVYVAWASGRSGEIRASRSLDGGKTFAIPVLVGHGSAPALAVNDRDYVYIAWVQAAALHFAYSSDGGRSFHEAKTIASPVCADCAPAIKIEGKKHPVVLWREAGGLALTHFAAKDQPGPILPVGGDACRDCAGLSPALAVGPQGEYYAAWANDGVLFSASLDHGREFSKPARPAPAKPAGPPDVLADGAQVHLAWTESDGGKTVLRGQFSPDNGESWSPPVNLAETTGGYGQPTLLAYQGRHYVAWQTQERGFKLIAVD